MPVSQRAGIKRPAFVVVSRKESIDEPFMYPDVEFCVNSLPFLDAGWTGEFEVSYPLKEIVKLPRWTIKRRIWKLPCRNYEKHVVINDIAFPESLWEDFGIKLKKPVK